MVGIVYSDTKAARKKVVKPALHKKYILAPTTEQRLRYKQYLSVYGKDTLLVSTAMKTLIEDFYVCYPSSSEHCSLVKQSTRLL